MIYPIIWMIINNYTERFGGFMLNGGIPRRKRHGLKAGGNYVIKDETI